MGVLSACISVKNMHVKCLWRPKKVLDLLKLELDSDESPCGAGNFTQKNSQQYFKPSLGRKKQCFSPNTNSEKARIKFSEIRILNLYQGQMLQMSCDVSLHMTLMLLCFFFSNPFISSDLISIIYTKYLSHVTDDTLMRLLCTGHL